MRGNGLWQAAFDNPRLAPRVPPRGSGRPGAGPEVGQTRGRGERALAGLSQPGSCQTLCSATAFASRSDLSRAVLSSTACASASISAFVLASLWAAAASFARCASALARATWG